VIADGEAEPAERVCDLVGSRLELAVGQDLLGTGHDDGRSVRRGPGEVARVLHVSHGSAIDI
jgi:hypothetical protein